MRSRDRFHEMNHHRHAGPMGDRRKTMTSADHIEEGLEGDISDEELEAHFSLAQYEYEHEDEDDGVEDLIDELRAKRSELYAALDELLEKEGQ